ncbi:MAG: YdiU family protein [Polyangiaceae bacterium]|nr:YdiU family protein [Polyangiaceae bacterium]
MPVDLHYRGRTIHRALDEDLYEAVEPAKFPRHILRFRNQRWAERVGLGGLTELEWEGHFARFSPLPDNLERPLALAYHGHQFDVYNPHLGDGRGFLFAQLEDDAGRILDLGTKGSGQTRWSRGGDGRLTLKGGVREVLATEMLEALGVSTSKSFSLFETGEALFRGDEPSPTRSSVLVRLSHSHIRFGTFQRLFHLEHADAMRKLVEHVVEHYFPDLQDRSDLPSALLARVANVMANLAASYTIAGFVHGVLNSDNMNVTGESFDYGPYRFLPKVDPSFTAAYFDHGGLYAFGRQPTAILRNVRRLGDSLRLTSPSLAVGDAIASFESEYARRLGERFVARLGVASAGPETDTHFAKTALAFLADSPVGYDNFYFDWAGGAASTQRALEGGARAVYEVAGFSPVRDLMELYVPRCTAMLATPYFQRSEPVTVLYDVIEKIWSRIDRADDWDDFDRHIAAIRSLGAARCVV